MLKDTYQGSGHQLFHFFVLQLPLMVPIIVLIVCVYLTVAPFLGPVRTEFLYALGYLLLGALIYVPFVLLKLSIPGIGKY